MTAIESRKETITTDVPCPISMTHQRVNGTSWNVAWRQGGFQVKRKVSDYELAALCEWAARYADNATLIVTPLP